MKTRFGQALCTAVVIALLITADAFVQIVSFPVK